MFAASSAESALVKCASKISVFEVSDRAKKSTESGWKMAK